MLGKVESEWVNASPFVPSCGGGDSKSQGPVPPKIEILAEVGSFITQAQIQESIDVIWSANRSSQISFLRQLLPKLRLQTLLIVHRELTDLIRVDFLNELPVTVLSTLVQYIDDITLSNCALTCRKWHEKLGPLWMLACYRAGIDIYTDTHESCITRLRRLRFRERGIKSGKWDNVIQMYCEPSVPADDTTLCYIPESHPRGSHLGTVVSPGMLVFYPIPETNGSTMFLRTPVLEKPTCMHTCHNIVFLAYSWGLIQMWNWHTNALVCTMETRENISCLQYCAQFDLLFVATHQGIVYVWKPLKMILVACIPRIQGNASVIEMQYLLDCTLDVESTSEDSGTCSPSPKTRNRIHVAFTAQYSQQRNQKQIRSNGQTWCSLSVWEIDPLSGKPVINTYNVTPGKRGLRATLSTNESNNTFLYISENYETHTYPSPDARLHELNPVTGMQICVALDCYSPEDDVTMEWQILGVGSNYAALGLWQLTTINDIATPTSTFIICQRTNDESEDRNDNESVSLGDCWREVLSLNTSDIASSCGTGLFSRFQLTNKQWLNGFDGLNDVGHVLAAIYWDYVQGGWMMRSFRWNNPTNKAFN